ncbi:MAG: YraN family protein [Microbacteriaceae bacterium]
MAAKDTLGRRGETLAAAYLEGADYDIIECNWRCSQGEIDIVATRGPTLVFVEVKTRTGVGFGHPFQAVTPAKLARLRRLAAAWCEAHPGSEFSRSIRIDVIGVIAPRGGPVEIEHLEQVF